MLQSFRSGNHLLVGVLVTLIVATFVTTFGSWGGGNLKNDLPIAAVINGEAIPTSQFVMAYSNMYNFMSQFQPDLQDNPQKLQKMRQDVLDNIVDSELLAQAAEEHGIYVSDEELAKAIKARLFGDKPFDKKLYSTYVNNMRTTEAKFEEMTRRDLMAQHMREVLGATQQASEEEISKAFADRNNRVDLHVVTIDPLYFKNLPEPADADVQTWIAGNDAAITTFYNDHINRYRQPKKVKASHILAKVAKDATDEQKKAARTKIEAALKRVTEGKEDFAKVAEEVSEDGSAKSGGDLGFFGPGAMVKPFEDAAFALKAGETSGIVESQFGFHVIKVSEIKEPETRELSDPAVKNEIAKQLFREEAQMKEARKLAEKALADLQAGIDPEKLLLTATTGKATGKADAVKADAADKADKTAKADKADKADKKGKKGKKDKKGDKADDAADKADKAADAKAAAKDADKDEHKDEATKDPFAPRVDTTGWFAQNARFIPRIGSSQEIIDAAFALTKESPVAGKIIESGKKLYVIKLKDREQADPSKLAESRSEIEDSLVQPLRQAVVESFLAERRKKSKIQRNDSLVTGKNAAAESAS